MYYPGSTSVLSTQIPYSSFIGGGHSFDTNPSDQVPALSSPTLAAALCQPQPTFTCLSDKKMISAQNATVLPLPVVNPFHLSGFCPPPPPPPPPPSASHNPYNVVIGQSSSKETATTTLVTSSKSSSSSSSSAAAVASSSSTSSSSSSTYEQTSSIMDPSGYGIPHPHHPPSHPHHPFTAYSPHYYLNTVPQPNPPPPPPPSPSPTVLNGGFNHKITTNGLSTSPVYPAASVNNGFFRPAHPSNGTTYLRGAPPPSHHQVHHHHHASTIYNESFTIPDYINRPMVVDVASKTPALYPATSPVTVAASVAATTSSSSSNCSSNNNNNNAANDEHNSFSDHLKRLQESFQSKSHNNANKNKCNDCSSSGGSSDPNPKTVPENGHSFHHHHHHHHHHHRTNTDNSNKNSKSEMNRNSFRIKQDQQQTFSNGDLSNDGDGDVEETKNNVPNKRCKFSQVWNPLIGKSNTENSDNNNHRSSTVVDMKHEKLWNGGSVQQSKSLHSASCKGGKKNPTNHHHHHQQHSKKNEIIKKSNNINTQTVKKDNNNSKNPKKRKLPQAADDNGDDQDQDQNQDGIKRRPSKANKSNKKSSVSSKNCDKLVNDVQSPRQKNCDSQKSFNKLNQNTSTLAGADDFKTNKLDHHNDDDDDDDDENGSSWISSIENGDQDDHQKTKSKEPKKCLNGSVLPDDDEDEDDDGDGGDKITTIKDVKLINKKSANYARRRRFRSGLDMIRNFRKKPPKAKSATINNKDSLNHSSVDEQQKKKKNKKDSCDSGKDLKRLMVNKSLGETLLHRSARNNRLDVIRQCLESEACDVNAKDNAGYTPLHECSSRGHLEVARLLLQHGADVNASAIGGIRPLHDAIECNHIETVRLLLSYGADPLISTYSGTTPLQLCRSKVMKKFLEGFYQDIGMTDLAMQDDGNVWLFKFDSSSIPDQSGFDVFGDLSDVCDTDDDDDDDDENDFRFQISTKPFLNVYEFLPKPDQSPFYLLTDVIKSLNVSREQFIQKHPQIKIMTINQMDYLKHVIPVQLEARINHHHHHHQNIIKASKNVKNNSNKNGKKSTKAINELDRSRPSSDQPPPPPSTTDEVIEIIYEDERILKILDIETTVIRD